MGYASRTGTARNLAVLRDAGWHLLISATGVHRHEGFTREAGLGYALDNGAWSSRDGRSWDAAAFELLLRDFGSDADWVVAPDVVAGGPESLRLTVEWLPRLLDSTARVLVAVQNGMAERDVEHLLGSRVGIAVGGGCVEHARPQRFGACSACDWKEQSTLGIWGPLARKVGCYLHVLRVNSARRIKLCHEAGVDSFDGTSVTKFAVNIRKLDAARRLRPLEFAS